MKKSLLVLTLIALLGSGCKGGTSSSSKVNSSPVSSSEVSSSEKTSSSSSKVESSSSSESSKTPEVTIYSLKGKVLNTFDGNLEGVKLFVNGNEVTTTNSNGEFVVSDVAKADSYKISFVKDGYESYELDVASKFLDNKEINLGDIELVKAYANFGSLESKKWSNYEAFIGSVSRNSTGMLFRFRSNNTVFTSEGRNSKLELYISTGEVSGAQDSYVTQIVVHSDKTTSIKNCGGLDTSNADYKANVKVENGKTEVEIYISYSSLNMSKDQIIGMSFGLWSEVDKDWAPMFALDTTSFALVENPSLYVRCDKDNFCFINTKNEYPKEEEFNKEELIAGRPYNVANPTNAGNASADDLYVKVITNESSFTFDMVGFGEFADDEYIKLVLHTSDTDGSGWAIQESDVSFLVSKSKAVKKTGITDFWGLEKFEQSDVPANHSLVHNANDQGYFTMSFEVDFTEIPNYASDVEVSFFMFEFGAPGLYNAAPWNSAMTKYGVGVGDAAAQSSYQVIQEKVISVDKEALLADYKYQFSTNYYANIERGEYSVVLNLISFNHFNSSDFIRFIVDTDGNPATGVWVIDPSDVGLVICKDVCYLETGKSSFWDGEANKFHGTNTTLNTPEYTEYAEYWTLKIEIDYSELGLNVTKDSKLAGLLIQFNPTIQNHGFNFNGYIPQDVALQNNYFQF
jgi:hypothetical protein